MRAVITAGGTVDDAYARVAGTRIKALALIRERSMLQRTIDAIVHCGITDIAVVGGPEVRAACDGIVRTVDARETGAQNVQLALNAWPDDEPLLYATSDMPYIDADAMRDFIARTPHGTLAMPLSEYDAFVCRFPNAPPFGITLAGERVVNGGVFLIPAGARAAISRLASTMFDARKAPWRMAKLVGPSFLIRFALKRLSIAQLEGHALRILGIPAIAVRNAAPELAFDADVVEEFRYALDHE